MKLAAILGATVLMAGCAAGAKDAKTADDVKEAASLDGQKVCIAELVGVRYELEDELVEQQLAPEQSCMFADIQLEETGEASAWVMRYQRVGDEEWQECKSSASDRAVFAEKCIGEMISTLSGS